MFLAQEGNFVCEARFFFSAMLDETVLKMKKIEAEI